MTSNAIFPATLAPLIDGKFVPADDNEIVLRSTKKIMETISPPLSVSPLYVLKPLHLKKPPIVKQ